ncbi:MAG: hypothetical protein ACWGON_10495 [Gemmatimonadota bacterium]
MTRASEADMEKDGAGVFETRIRNLETSNRRLRIGMASMSLLVLAIALSAFTGARPSAGIDARDRTRAAEEVQASAFRLVDEDGNLGASLFFGEAGPRLELCDSVGVPRVSLEHDSEGTALYLRDSEGTIRIGAAQFAHGGGGFAIHGEQAVSGEQ